MWIVLWVFCFPSGFFLLSEESKEHEICCELWKSISIVALCWLVGLLAVHEKSSFSSCVFCLFDFGFFSFSVLMLWHLTALRSYNSSSFWSEEGISFFLGKNNYVLNKTTHELVKFGIFLARVPEWKQIRFSKQF